MRTFWRDIDIKVGGLVKSWISLSSQELKNQSTLGNPIVEGEKTTHFNLLTHSHLITKTKKYFC